MFYIDISPQVIIANLQQTTQVLTTQLATSEALVASQGAKLAAISTAANTALVVVGVVVVAGGTYLVYEEITSFTPSFECQVSGVL